MGAFLFAQIMNIRFKFIDVLKIIIPSKASTFKYIITEKAREKSIKNKQTIQGFISSQYLLLQ